MKKTIFYLVIFFCVCHGLDCPMKAQDNSQPVAVINIKSKGVNSDLIRMSAPLPKIEGKHTLTLRWKDQSGSVQNIFFDRSNITAIITPEHHGDQPSVSCQNGVLSIQKHNTGDKAFLYDLSGRLVESFTLHSDFFEKRMDKGFFILCIKNNNQLFSHKIIF